MNQPTSEIKPTVESKVKPRHLLRKITAFFAIFFTSILCILAIIYSSSWGAHGSLSIINKFLDVDLTYKSGTFSEGIEFSNIAYNNDDINFEATQVKLKFHLRCLWQKQLCVNTLIIKDLSLKITSTTEPEIKQDFKLIDMPLAINIKNINVQKATVQLTDQLIELYNFSSAIDIKKSTFTFNNPSLKHVLVNASNNQETAVKNSTDEAALTLPEIKLPLRLNINNLTLDKFSHNLLPEESLVTTLRDIKIGLSWFKSDISLNLLNLHYDVGSINLKGKILLAENYPLEMQLTHQLINNPYWSEINNSEFVVNAKGDLSQLSVKFTSKGSLVATGNGNINLTSKKLPYKINIQADKIPLYDAISEHLHPSALSLVSEGDLNNQTLSLSSKLNGLGYKNANAILKMSHSALDENVAKKLASTATTIDKTATKTLTKTLAKQLPNNVTKALPETFAKSEITLDELSLNDANNHLNVKGNVLINNQPHWHLNINSTGFTLPKLSLKDTQYQYLEKWVSGRIQGNINTTGIYDKENSSIKLTNTHLSGKVNNIPFEVSGEIDLNQNLQLKPSTLKLLVHDAMINISGYSDNEWHITGNIEVPDASKFQSDINGSSSTRIDIIGGLNSPNILFKNNIKGFSYNAISLSDMTLQGVYSPFDQNKIDAHIKSKSISLSTIELTQLNAKINADNEQQTLDVNWDGDFKSQFLLNGQLNKNTLNWVGVVANAEFNYLSHQWRPDNDIIIDYKNKSQKISLNKHCWENQGLNLENNQQAVQGLTLCLPKVATFSDSGKIPLTVQLDTQYFNGTLIPNDLLINTNIEGNALLTWTPNAAYNVTGNLDILAGKILLDEKQVDIPIKVLSAWDHGQVTFKVNNNLAQINLSLEPDKKNNTRANNDFYSSINVAGKITLKGDYPLTANIDINNFNLRPFQSISHELTSLEGILNAKINVSGYLENPKINGNIKLLDGRFKSLKSPNVMNDVKINISLLDTYAKLDGTFNIDKDKGELSGDAKWQKEKELNLLINSERLSIMVPPQIEATFAPKINARLTPSSLKLSGQVNVLDGILRIINLPEGSIELTNDVIFVDRQGDEIVKEKDFTIESDIKVFINEAFQLTGQGFNGNLSGDLRVQHSNQQPLQLFGNLSIPDGRYHAYGQRLQIERGKVSFNGPSENPHIDIKATRTIPKENIKVGVEIKGLANALSLKLISSPTLSRAQILSYLLRGQGLKSDAPDDSGIGVALGAALANYSGILKQVEKLPLLNNVEIGGDSNQVSIAGYVGERIYLKYGVGVNEPVNELTVRLFLMSRLWLETISGLEKSVDIYYSFDTD